MLENLRQHFEPLEENIYEKICTGAQNGDLETIVRTIGQLEQVENPQPYFYTLKSVLYQMADFHNIDPYRSFVIKQSNVGTFTAFSNDTSYFLGPQELAFLQLKQSHPDANYFEKYWRISGNAFVDEEQRELLSVHFIKKYGNEPLLFPNEIVPVPRAKSAEVDKFRLARAHTY